MTPQMTKLAAFIVVILGITYVFSKNSKSSDDASKQSNRKNDISVVCSDENNLEQLRLLTDIEAKQLTIRYPLMVSPTQLSKIRKRVWRDKWLTMTTNGAKIEVRYNGTRDRSRHLDRTIKRHGQKNEIVDIKTGANSGIRFFPVNRYDWALESYSTYKKRKVRKLMKLLKTKTGYKYTTKSKRILVEINDTQNGIEILENSKLRLTCTGARSAQLAWLGVFVDRNSMAPKSQTYSTQTGINLAAFLVLENLAYK